MEEKENTEKSGIDFEVCCNGWAIQQDREKNRNDKYYSLIFGPGAQKEFVSEEFVTGKSNNGHVAIKAESVRDYINLIINTYNCDPKLALRLYLIIKRSINRTANISKGFKEALKKINMLNFDQISEKSDDELEELVEGLISNKNRNQKNDKGNTRE